MEAALDQFTDYQPPSPAPAPAVLDWTPERDALLRQLWPQPITQDAIAARIGIGPKRIVRRAHELNLTGRPQLRTCPVATGIWTEEKTELLRKLWAAGVSGTGIASALGPGFTRNSVIGKVHRLGLPGRKTTERKAKSYTPGASRKRQASAGWRLMVDVTTALPADRSDCAVPLYEAKAHHCRWPIGEGASFMFCGAPKVFGAYCGRHALLAYEPAGPRR